MTKSELKQDLLRVYDAFVDCLRQVPAPMLNQSRDGKWSPAQQLEHLIKSVRPVALAFSLPKFLLPILFGKANRPSRTYDELITRYKSKLAAGGKSTKPFLPGDPGNVDALYERIGNSIRKLTHHIDRFSETELDQFILPHPLLGKLTLREMLYFTVHHAQHHQAQIEVSRQTSP